MWKILKSKKASTPIIGDILNFIGHILSVTPAWLKYLMFIFIIVSAAWASSYAFMLIGNFCNSANQPVNTGINPISNLWLIWEQGKDPTELEGILPGSGDVATKCSIHAPNGSLVTAANGEAYMLSSPTWFYEGGFCTRCEEVTVQTSPSYTVCEGDVQRDDDKTFLQKTFCGGLGCEPPKGYYWEQTTNRYVCNSESCENENWQTTWDEKLAEKGATLLYKDENGELDPSGDKFVGMVCTDMRPKLGVYGVDLFDYRIWLTLTLIGMMIYGFSHIKR